jgi:hypothetical protein
MINICFNCGKEMAEDIDECSCGFSFNEIFACPYKKDNHCTKLNLDCNRSGLDFEACQTFLASIGIII